MSNVGIVDGFVHIVTDTADKVKQGAEWVEKVAEKVGLPTVAKYAGNVGKYAGKLAVAPGPILSGGQKIIDKMRDTTGEGDPERAAAYGDAGRAFHAARDTLANAHPNSAWEGTGAKMYSQRNAEQENVTTTLGDTDMQVATIISSEADQLVRLRRILDYNHNLLADVGQWTQWLGTLGPEGKAAQATVEGFYVAMALDQCTPEMWQMHNSSNANAAAIRGLRDVYQQAKSKVTISDSVGDFDPRNTGPAPGAPAPSGGPPANEPSVPSGPVPAPVPSAPAGPSGPASAAPPAVPMPAGPVVPAPMPAASTPAAAVAPAASAAPTATGGGLKGRQPSQKLSAPTISNAGPGVAPGRSSERAPVENPSAESGATPDGAPQT